MATLKGTAGSFNNASGAASSSGGMFSSLKDGAMWLVDNGLYNTKKPWYSGENLMNIGFLGLSGAAGVVSGGTGTAGLLGARIGGGALLKGAQTGGNSAFKWFAKKGAEEGTEALTKRELIKIGREAAEEVRDASRAGILLRPTAGADRIGNAALRKIDNAVLKKDDKGNLVNVSKFSKEELEGFASIAAKKAQEGGLLKRAFKNTASFAVGHPVITAAGGVAAYTATSGLPGVQTLTDTVGGVLGFGKDAIGSGIKSGITGLTGAFNTVSSGLEYMGMDPTWAKMTVAFGAFMALQTGLSFAGEKIGFGKLPFSGLAITLGAAAIAFQLYNSATANDVRNNVAPDPVETPKKLTDLLPLAPSPAAFA